MSAVQDLRWEIQQLLHQLTSAANSSLLYKIAVSCKDEMEKDWPGEDATNAELLDFIVDFVRSKQLKGLEDQGMARLLILKDLIDELQTPQPTAEGGIASGEEHADSEAETEPVLEVGATVSTTVPTMVAGHGTGLVKLSDVAAFLPRREYKIHGGQISDHDSDLSFNNLCKQIDEGLAEGFTPAEVIRTVLKITKPGTFRDMLITKDGLTIDELKRFLRVHLREKSSTELFQELSNAKQNDRESPQ